MLKIRSKFFILAMAIAIAGCARDHQPSETRKPETGGGDFIYSSREEVLQTVYDVWALFNDDTMSNPLTVGLQLLAQKAPVGADETRAHFLLKKILSVDRGDFSEIQTQTSVYLKRKKLHLPEAALCDGPQDRNYMAAVTAFNRGGEICLSVFGLMRQASGSLRVDVYGLMVHAIAHLNGFGEGDARLLQKYFLVNNKRILRKDSYSTRRGHVLKIWQDVNGNWPALITYESIDMIYLRRLHELHFSYANLIMNYFSDVVPGDDIGIARPEMLSSIHARLDFLRPAIANLGKATASLYDRSRRLRLTAGMLLDARKIAKEMIALQRDIEEYFLGDRIDVESAKIYAAEETLIDRATNPATLTSRSLRPEMYCPENTTEPRSTWARAHPQYHSRFIRRCSSTRTKIESP